MLGARGCNARSPVARFEAFMVTSELAILGAINYACNSACGGHYASSSVTIYVGLAKTGQVCTDRSIDTNS